MQTVTTQVIQKNLVKHVGAQKSEDVTNHINSLQPQRSLPRAGEEWVGWVIPASPLPLLFICWLGSEPD